jgi:hypothetical protein
VVEAPKGVWRIEGPGLVTGDGLGRRIEHPIVGERAAELHVLGVRPDEGHRRAGGLREHEIPLGDVV